MFNLNTCKYDFSTDTINIFLFLYDNSGSMQDHASAIREANTEFYNDFSKFEEKDSVAIAQYYFNDRLASNDFRPIEEFRTSYHPESGTELYYAISKAAHDILTYRNEIIKRTNIEPRITFLVFTDGGDNNYGSKHGIKSARDAVQYLKEKGTTCVFIPFGRAIELNDGETLGFDCIEKADSKDKLKKLLGEELSKSCKEQSKSAYSLGSKFFSKVAGKKEPEEESVIDDDDFFDV